MFIRNKQKGFCEVPRKTQAQVSNYTNLFELFRGPAAVIQVIVRARAEEMQREEDANWCKTNEVLNRNPFNS